MRFERINNGWSAVYVNSLLAGGIFQKNWRCVWVHTKMNTIFTVHFFKDSIFFSKQRALVVFLNQTQKLWGILFSQAKKEFMLNNYCLQGLFYCSDPSWGGRNYILKWVILFRQFWPIDIFIVEKYVSGIIKKLDQRRVRN